MNDLGPAERFVAGAVGQPGRRTFLLEITAGGELYSLVAEKEQVAALAAQVLQLMEAAAIEPDEEAVATLVRSGGEVSEPEQESFRVGGIQVAVLESHLMAITITADDDESTGVRFLVAPEQMRAMALVALQVVAAGRAICPRCQLPLDPEGHRCPAVNGHHPS